MGDSTEDKINPEEVAKLYALFRKAETGQMHNLNKTEPCEKWLKNEPCRFHDKGFCKYSHGMADAFPREFEFHSFKEQYCGKDECAYSDRCKFVHDDIKFDLQNGGMKLYYSEKEQTYRLALKSDRSKVLVYKFAASPDLRDLQFYDEYLPIFEKIRRVITPTRNFRPANLEKACAQGRSMRPWGKRRNLRPLRQNLMTKRGQNFQFKGSNVTWVPLVTNGQVPIQVISAPAAGMSPNNHQQTIFYTPPSGSVYSPTAVYNNGNIMSWGNAQVNPVGEVVTTSLSQMSLQAASPQAGGTTHYNIAQPGNLIQPQIQIVQQPTTHDYQTATMYASGSSPQMFYNASHPGDNTVRVAYDPVSYRGRENLYASGSSPQMFYNAPHPDDNTVRVVYDPMEQYHMSSDLCSTPPPPTVTHTPEKISNLTLVSPDTPDRATTKYNYPTLNANKLQPLPLPPQF